MPAIPWRVLAAPQADHQYVVMASKLPLRSARSIPHFLRLTAAVARQLEHTEGLVGYSLLAQLRARTFWTLSAWTDAAHLAAFTRALPHAAVMRDLRPLMGASAFTTWSVPASALPITWEEARGRLAEVPPKRPAPAQQTG